MADKPRRSVLLACPWYTCEPETAFCLSETLVQLAYDGQVFQALVSRCASIGHARSRLVAIFMHTKCDYMLMADGDMTWTPQAVKRLRDHDVPFVAVSGMDRNRERLFVGKEGFGKGDLAKFDYDVERGLITVPPGDSLRVGACFMMIRRDTIETLMAKYPELHLGEQETDEELRPYFYAFFQTKARDGWLPTEDYFFCDLLRGAGVPIMIDPWIELGHVVPKVLRGKLVDTLRMSDDVT